MSSRVMRSTLSLFNGIGIGIQALKDLGVSVEKSYVSEIDKFANKTNMKNHPESIQLGDITQWREWNIDWSRVDLVTAGFPCQAWSMAGQQLGDKDPRGMLFWTSLEVISHVLKHNPGAKWMMENVRMKREFEEYITHHTTEALGYVEKALINSALVTAQNRNRYYWSNFPISQPEDRGILLRDIVEDSPDASFNINPLVLNKYVRNGRPKGFKELNDKSNCVTKGYGNDGCTVVGIEQRGRGFNKGGIHTEKSPTLTSRSWEHNHKLVRIGTASDIKGHGSIKRVYSVEGKCPTLTTMGGGHREPKVAVDEQHYRKLTPIECERLQGYSDNYTGG